MTRPFGTATTTSVRIFLAGLLLTAASGCGGNKTGNVSGTVKFQGKPLPGGYVNFYSIGANGDVRAHNTGPINDKGEYSVAKVPVGDVKITVQGPPGVIENVKKQKGGIPVRGKAPVILPLKYGDLEQTDLKYTVTLGDQKHEIDLK